MSASLVHVAVTIEHDEFGTFEPTGLDEDSCEFTRRRVAPAIYNTLKNRPADYRDATLEKFLGRNDPACPGEVRPGEVSRAHGGVLRRRGVRLPVRVSGR